MRTPGRPGRSRSTGSRPRCIASRWSCRAMPDKRAYTAGKYALEVGRISAGWIQKFSGGSATAGVKYEDIVLEVGTGMSKGFYEWIKAAWDGKSVRQDGAVIVTDYDFKEQSRKTFHLALITETVLPALDAASKDAAKMTVKLTPESVRTTTGSGKQTSTSGGNAQAQKKWLPSNFKLEIPGLDCTRVNKIGELVVKQKVVENPVGELRDYEKEPAHAEFGNLTVTMAESLADSWYKWFEDFVIKGNCGQDQEKSGSLIYLASDMKTELLRVSLSNLGIFKLAEEHVEAGSEGIRRVKAELYVERMQFQYGGAMTFA